jgi:hypothetical protein
VDTLIDAFPSCEYISVPLDLWLDGDDKVAEGDNRMFGYQDYGGARIRMRFSLWNSAAFSSTFVYDPRATHRALARL